MLGRMKLAQKLVLTAFYIPSELQTIFVKQTEEEVHAPFSPFHIFTLEASAHVLFPTLNDNQDKLIKILYFPPN